jgi:hypothetical protein
MGQPKIVTAFKANELCYNGLLLHRNRYLYSSRSGQIWRSEYPSDCPDIVQGFSPLGLIAVWNLSPDKNNYWAKNIAARKSLVSPQEFKTVGMVYVIYKGKHYWQHKDNLYRIKWTRASHAELAMAFNFSE